MPTKSVVVGSSVGLHARPAAIISEAAGALDAEVTINGVDASSALMLMTLGDDRAVRATYVAGACVYDRARTGDPFRSFAEA